MVSALELIGIKTTSDQKNTPIVTKVTDWSVRQHLRRYMVTNLQDMGCQVRFLLPLQIGHWEGYRNKYGKNNGGWTCTAPAELIRRVSYN